MLEKIKDILLIFILSMAILIGIIITIELTKIIANTIIEDIALFMEHI